MSPDLTLRQIAKAWPACATRLQQYPGVRWNGQWSLQELRHFARDVGLEEHALVHELANVAGVPLARSAAPAPDRFPILLVFIAIGLGLSLGASWGVGLLLRIAFAGEYSVASAAGVHIHGLAQFWGWMALFVLAIASFQLRQNTRPPAPRWLERLTAAGMIVGVLVFFLGQFSGSPTRWNVTASTLLAIASGGFGTIVLWSLIGRGQRPQLWHVFVLAMTFWLWVWAGVDLAARWQPDVVPSDRLRNLLIVIPTLGFANNAIYGFGLRLIPGLLNIGRLRWRFVAATTIIHNAGLALFLIQQPTGSMLGAVFMLVGAFAYLIGLDFLRSRPARPIYGVDIRGHVLIRIPFCWLIAALLMVVIQTSAPALPHPYTGAWRHALTVGFISTLMVGVGCRLVPIILKQPLWSPRLMLIGGGFLVIGNAGRVMLELLTITGQPWTFRLMGLTGVLELTGLLLFGINLFNAWLARRRTYQATLPLTADTRVREAINEHPALQQRLRDLGITMFEHAPFIAPSMTFGALALASGLTPATLVARLRE